MTTNLEQLYTEIANGDLEAFDFLFKWQTHCHAVDDIVDRESKSPETILETFVAAQDLMRHPFFTKNEKTLYMLHVLSANAYCDSIELMQSSDKQEIQLGDVLRSWGNEMVILIAGLCAKEDENIWKRIRKYSRIIRQASWEAHHNKETGEPC